ncbi:FAD binding domain-containing protein [Nocardioides humi]|uniref:Xanthine dehydrogenase family protein subunit M n=1 Tax=Nocardioides humi TaxID=449461 RepID=A0ABN2A800_9ACTN|nr:FAD binding domain-containing protein [Nocardioides humi]
MKPAAFDIRTPASLDEALADLAELAERGDDVRPLAGGQSLIPLLNFRMSQPEVLVDLGDLDELRFVRREPDGGLRIGAMTTMSYLLDSPLVVESHPILRDTLRYVAHEPIRNRGTIGGSLSHMDPAAELPALALLLEVEIVLSSVRGRRTVPAADFLQGAYMTSIEEGELLTEVRIPPLPGGARTGVVEVAQRTGDFALAGAACVLRADVENRVQELRTVVFGSSTSPTRLPDVDAHAVGRVADADLALEVAGGYAAGIQPLDDRHGPADFRRHLTRVMVTRAIRDAAGLRLR